MMFSTLFATTLLFTVFALRARAECFVATVGLTQCQPATLSWDQTTPPYNVIITSASNPCGDALVDLGDLDTNSFNWPNVNLTAGTSVMISVMDGNDQEGWSGAITVQPSDDSSCLTTQNNTPSQSQPSNPPNYPEPSPTTTTTSSSKPPAATVVGAANNGIMNSATSTIHLSGMAVAFTAFCALVALL